MYWWCEGEDVLMVGSFKMVSPQGPSGMGGPIG